ncbi:hypothetical protein TNCV_791441 [Trichonephila clavipes]|nr:hypothetical protein TNCV_791441 [Trichonephila clavipes]
MCLIERQLQTAVNNIVKWCDNNGHSISRARVAACTLPQTRYSSRPRTTHPCCTNSRSSRRTIPGVILDRRFHFPSAYFTIAEEV